MQQDVVDTNERMSRYIQVPFAQHNNNDDIRSKGSTIVFITIFAISRFLSSKMHDCNMVQTVNSFHPGATFLRLLQIKYTLI